MAEYDCSYSLNKTTLGRTVSQTSELCSVENHMEQLPDSIYVTFHAAFNYGYITMTLQIKFS